MNFCSNCGGPLILLIPPGDDRGRYFCETCGIIHYQNPLMIVGCIPEIDDKILLCRRAIEPCYGQWTLPAGYLENGESVSEGAKRETWEEAGALVEDLSPYALYNICHINQIYLMFRGLLKNDHVRPGSESLEVDFFSENKIPWRHIAFRVIKKTLQQYYTDRRRGRFLFYVSDIPETP